MTHASLAAFPTRTQQADMVLFENMHRSILRGLLNLYGIAVQNQRPRSRTDGKSGGSRAAIPQRLFVLKLMSTARILACTSFRLRLRGIDILERASLTMPCTENEARFVSSEGGWLVGTPSAVGLRVFRDRIGREQKVCHQRLEVGPRAERVEVGVAFHPDDVAVTGVDRAAEHIHRPIELGCALGDRQARVCGAGNAPKPGAAAGQGVKKLTERERSAQRDGNATNSSPHSCPGDLSGRKPGKSGKNR